MEVTEIYAQFHRSLLSFIRGKVRSSDDAEDILQNVFIKILANVDKLTAEERLRGWVYAITRNAIIDYYRSKAIRTNMALDESLESSLPEAEEIDSTKGLDQCMTAMINLLPDEYRNIIVESEINGMRQKDLAHKYGMAYPSMRSRVQRGRDKLRQLFYDCCHIETDKLGNILEVKGRSSCDGPCNPCSE